MNKLYQFNTFVGLYADSYRLKYDIDQNIHVLIPFIGHSGHLVVKVLVTEPSTAVGEFWYDGTYLRITTSLVADTVNGHLHTYDTVTFYEQVFDGATVFIGEFLDIGILPPDFYLGRNVGSLKVFDGLQYRDLNIGSDGTTLIADSTKALGVRWEYPTVVDISDSLKWAGVWVTAKEYYVGNVVRSNKTLYVCNTQHISAGNIPTVEWDLFLEQIDGVQGTIGITGLRGPSALNWQSVWDQSKIYNKDDAVLYNRSTYRSKTDGNTTLPTTISWEFVALGNNPYEVVTEEVCGQPIDKYRVVIVGNSGLEPASNSISTHAHRVLGMSLESGNTGDTIQVIVSGIVTNPAWNNTVGSVIYVGLGGGLVNVQPTSGFISMFGVAISKTEILIRQLPSIVL